MIRILLTLLATITLSAAIPERRIETRLKDIAQLRGQRSNQLIGYGLVMGLEGTGDKDQTKFTMRSLSNLMARQGISVEASAKVKNVAAVLVTAELPAFARAGQRVDVTVSSIGDAKSLAGGYLVMTPLNLGSDNEEDTYASAQGSVLVGGFAPVTRGGGGAAAAKNHPTAGRIPDGAVIEREVGGSFADLSNLRYALREDDFSTVVRVVEAINEELGEMVARAQDSRTIDVKVPKNFQGRAVELAARLENLSIQTQPKSRIVINEKTGTLIMGSEVRVDSVNIVHGGFSIAISSTPIVTPPQPSSDDTTAIAPTIARDQNKSLKVESGITVGELAESLNVMGVSPRDLVAILQAIKDAGALTAELRIL